MTGPVVGNATVPLSPRRTDANGGGNEMSANIAHMLIAHKTVEKLKAEDKRVQISFLPLRGKAAKA